MSNKTAPKITNIIEFTNNVKLIHVLSIIYFRNSSNAHYKVAYINKAFDSGEKPNETDNNFQSNIQNDPNIETSGQSGLFNQALLTCAIVLLACVR